MYGTKITLIAIRYSNHSLSLFLKDNKSLQFCHMFKTQYNTTIETIMLLCINKRHSNVKL